MTPTPPPDLTTVPFDHLSAWWIEAGRNETRCRTILTAAGYSAGLVDLAAAMDAAGRAKVAKAETARRWSAAKARARRFTPAGMYLQPYVSTTEYLTCLKRLNSEMSSGPRGTR